MYCGRKTLAISAAFGILMTAASSLFLNTQVIGEFPDLIFVSIPMIGFSYWGFPLPWLKVVDYPGAASDVIGTHLLLDAVFWSVLTLLLAVGLERMRGIKKSAKKPLKLTVVHRGPAVKRSRPVGVRRPRVTRRSKRR
jgi:hypothetical protein